MIEEYAKWECDLCHFFIETRGKSMYPPGGWIKMYPPNSKCSAHFYVICGDCVRKIVEEKDRIYPTSEVRFV